MNVPDPLMQFVHDGLRAGHSRAKITTALTDAGWLPTEIDAALDAWTNTPLGIPAPRPRTYVSAREGVMYGLIFIALMVTIWHMTALSFALIDRFLPDPLVDYHSYGMDSMRWSISALIVFMPLFLWLNARAERAVDSARPSAMRRAFASVTLFLAALALLGNAIAVIYALLGGEMTLRFAAKAGVVALLALLVLAYFRPALTPRVSGGRHE